MQVRKVLANWFKFRVQTLDDAALRNAAAELARVAGGFQPEVIIGVHTGGYVVAELVAGHFADAVLLPMTCRRPGTVKKREVSGLKRAIFALPKPVTGLLRIAEHIMLTQLRPPRQRDFVPDVTELAAISAALDGRERVLIVDDAVDSGATLLAVVDAVQIAAPGCTIKTAAITVTTDAPLIAPDYALYRHVLCRFPWSLDA